MPRVVPRVRNVAVILGLALTLGGCVVGPPSGRYYVGGVVTIAPPRLGLVPVR